MRTAWTLALILVGAPTIAAPAVAQPSGPGEATGEEAYRGLVEEAVRQSAERHYQEALALFLRAHELRPSARTLRGIGLVRFGLSDYAGAIRALEASLSDERRPLTDEHREEAESVLEQARRFVARVALQLTPTDARVSVDGRRIETEPDGVIEVNPGRHELRFERDGFDDETRSLVVEGGIQREVVVELRSLDDRAPPPDVEPEPEAEPIPLRVASNPEGLVLHATPINDAGEPQPNVVSEVCVAPCSASLARGLYRLGLARRAQSAVAVGEYRIDAPLEVTLHLQDREDDRIAGWITMGAAVLISVALAAPIGALSAETPQVVMGILSTTIFTVGLSVGIPFAAFDDITALEVRPL